MKFFLALGISFLLLGCQPALSPSDPEESALIPSILETEKPIVPAEESSAKNQILAVEIDYFFDFTCEYCRAMVPIIQSLQSQYGRLLTVRFWHKPLTPEARLISQAALCAADQGAFEPFYESVWELKDQSISGLAAFATNLDLNAQQLALCLETGIGEVALAQHQSVAQDQRISAVPTLVFRHGEETKVVEGFASLLALQKIINGFW